MINITQLCRDANWHLATAIRELSKSLPWEDAEAFVRFSFESQAPVGTHPLALASVMHTLGGDGLSERQWDQLAMVDDDYVLKEE